MSWPDYSVWAQVAWWALVALTIFAVLRSFWKMAARTPGMRYPARRRFADVQPGLKARLVHLPQVLRSLALLLMVFAVSRPQIAREESADVEGIDIVIAFDMSGSMTSVDISDEDLVGLQNAGKEPLDRFKIAVEVIKDFISTRKYDRVSLVTFGKGAYLQFPLTLDYGAMLRIIDGLQIGDIDGSKTYIGNALSMGLARLKESEAKTRLIILLTDGEDNGSNISPLEMARDAANKAIPVFPILVGTDDQSRQPIGRVDAFSGRQIYKKVDNEVNPDLLQEIGEVTKGQFYRAADRKKLASDFVDIIDRFEKSRLVDYAAADRIELFPWFIFPALLLLLIEIILSQTWLRRFP